MLWALLRELTVPKWILNGGLSFSGSTRSALKQQPDNLLSGSTSFLLACYCAAACFFGTWLTVQKCCMAVAVSPSALLRELTVPRCCLYPITFSIVLHLVMLDSLSLYSWACLTFWICPRRSFRSVRASLMNFLHSENIKKLWSFLYITLLYKKHIKRLAHKESHSMLVVGLNRNICQDDLGPEKRWGTLMIWPEDTLTLSHFNLPNLLKIILCICITQHFHSLWWVCQWKVLCGFVTALKFAWL